MKLCFVFVTLSALVFGGVARKHTNSTSLENQKLNSADSQPKFRNLRFSDMWSTLESDKDVILLEEVLAEIEDGRGKSHKYKKISKSLYPLFMGVLIAKVVLIPIILKMLTAISAAALVMSKIALITTGLLALKWIFAGGMDSGDSKDHTHFELVYVPPAASHGKSYRGNKYWSDQSWADSQVSPDAVTSNDNLKYIPVKTMNNELAYAGSASIKSSLNEAAATSDLYRYNHHNYNHNLNDGKPFL